MNALCRWSAVGLLVLTAGCNKGGPAAGSAAGGAAASVPAKAATGVAPDVAMNDLMKSLSAGDTGAIWTAMPAKYQNDVKAVKNEFAAKMDADLWNKGFTVLGKTATLLKSKKDMILACPMMAGAPPESKAAMTKDWDSLVGVVDTLANSEIKTIDGLKKADPGQFFSSTGTTIAGHSVKAVKSANPDAANELKGVGETKFTLIKQDGDKATLKRESPGEPAQDEQFVKIDGKWVPEKVATDWDMELAGYKEKIATMVIPPEAKTQVMDVMTQVEGTLDKLIAAKDQAAFDGELLGMLVTFGPLMQNFGGGAPAMSGPPPGALPGGGPAISPPKIDTPKITPPTVTPPTTPDKKP